MKLTQEQLSSVMASLGCTLAPPSEDVRGRVRVPLGAKATVIPCADSARGEITRVVLVNLSEGGIGIVNGFPMRLGDQFILRTPAVASHPSTTILCTVIHCNSLSPQSFSIGGQFFRLLSLPVAVAATESFAKPDCENLGTQDMNRVREVEAKLSRLQI